MGPCGSCRLCCDHLSIATLGKERYCRCEFWKDRQCSLYDVRPKVCRSFECFWLTYRTELGLGLEHRPDKLGFGIVPLTFEGDRALVLWEYAEDSLEFDALTPAQKKMISVLQQIQDQARILVQHYRADAFLELNISTEG